MMNSIILSQFSLNIYSPLSKLSSGYTNFKRVSYYSNINFSNGTLSNDSSNSSDSLKPTFLNSIYATPLSPGCAIRKPKPKLSFKCNAENKIERNEETQFESMKLINTYSSNGSFLFGVALSSSLLPLIAGFSLASGELSSAQAMDALETLSTNTESLNPILSLLSFAPEPSNALSLPTWAIHVSSVAEWVTAMSLVWKFGEQTKFSAWQGLAWGMVPSLTGAMCACTWHFFYNDPRLEVLVALQSFLTMAGNFTLWLAAYRIYKQSQNLA